jgi:pyridoxine 4-dehydrogenase
MQSMRQMQDEGLAAHIGVSTVSAGQLHVARDIVPVVCVQNHYNLVYRDDDAMIDALAEAGIAYVPYFPLGGFTSPQAKELTRVADEMRRTLQSVAWHGCCSPAPTASSFPERRGAPICATTSVLRDWP